MLSEKVLPLKQRVPARPVHNQEDKIKGDTYWIYKVTCGKKVGGIVYGGEDGTEGNKDSHSFRR